MFPPPLLIGDTLPTLDENLALDEALLISAEAGETGEAMRLWEWPSPAVVLGAGGSVAIDVNEEACRADRVPIHRRASGGGTVVLGTGCLLFTLVLNYDRAEELRHVNSSYRWILGKIANALRSIAPIELAGISDLALGEMKVSGNAQQRKARYLLHHGSLLYHFDLPTIGRYLRRPERQPTYRGERDHSEFVANLPTDAATLQRLLVDEFEAMPAELPSTVYARLPGLITERYGREDWVRRR